MIKKVAYLSATVAILVLSGCSSKEPTIDKTANSSMPSASSTIATPATDSSAKDSNAAISSSANTNANTSVNLTAELSSIYFDFDKYDIRTDMESALKIDSDLVKNKTIKLEGNCDEFGSDEYNVALGLKRANAVKQALINMGMSADSINMVSLGKSNPVCAEQTKECWAKNRRVEFKLP
ncbi:MAG: OmpA family protein [Sulfuricurvum sp.]|nr:OmpA family protein [Sulfuricurvum sp.]